MWYFMLMSTLPLAHPTTWSTIPFLLFDAAYSAYASLSTSHSYDSFVVFQPDKLYNIE
jgi:hypothetical protein